MDIKEIMEINIDNLIEKQHHSLKQYTIAKLKNIINLIDKEQYDKVDCLLGFSPAGDGYGCNDYYINFNYDNCNRNISEIISELENLKYKLK